MIGRGKYYVITHRFRHEIYGIVPGTFKVYQSYRSAQLAYRNSYKSENWKIQRVELTCLDLEGSEEKETPD